MFDFKDKVAVVTGGARGIGLAIRRSFEKVGARVCVIDLLDNDFFVGDIADDEVLRAFADKVVCTHTVKRRLSDLSRIEIEEEIGEERFRELSERADPARSPIRKKRYLYEYDGQLFEIDVFPFWDDRAVMELELENEEQEIRLPPAIEIVREVTSDGRYTNSALAREIVRETI